MGVMRTRAYFPEDCFPEFRCSLRNAASGGEAEGCGRGRFWRCCMPRGSPVWRAGQMTVEFVVAFPVLIAVAVVAVNACLFFSECAAFDMVARDAVRTFATSPAFGEEGFANAAISEELERNFSRDYLSSRVESSSSSGGMVSYRMTLEFSPTLFSLGFKSEVFGVSLPKLTHTVGLTVDPYKPGVFL